MIPATAHFVWLGDRLPWVHALALLSACRAGGFDQIVLHHDRALNHTRWWRELCAEPRFSHELVDPMRVFSPLGARVAGLVRLYERLRTPAARANLLRLAILWRRGGVYLDMDTVTVRPFDPLRERTRAFCGREHVAFPSWARGPERLAAWARTTVREAFRVAPRGHRGFARIAAWYPQQANNAVLGAAPGHPLLELLFDRIDAMPPAQRLRRYELGPHLLEWGLRAYRGADVEVLPPEAFYPLGPRISEHWFRHDRSARLEDVIGPDTFAVHWYASVRTRRIVPRVDPAYVARHANRQLFSALAARYGPRVDDHDSATALARDAGLGSSR